MQTTESSEFRSEPGQLDPQHLWGGAAGLLLSVPLYVTLFTDLRENWDESDLAVGELLQSESGLFQVRVADEGWSQVGPEFMDEEAEMSFYGPSEWTWAVVYDYVGWHVDDVMEFRVQSIKENYSRASCTQTKTLDEATWTVTGSILCEGRSVLDGPYTYVSRVLRSEENVIEIVASTSDYDPDQSRRLSTRIQSFVDGLELIQ